MCYNSHLDFSVGSHRWLDEWAPNHQTPACSADLYSVWRGHLAPFRAHLWQPDACSCSLSRWLGAGLLGGTGGGPLSRGVLLWRLSGAECRPRDSVCLGLGLGGQAPGEPLSPN